MAAAWKRLDFSGCRNTLVFGATLPVALPQISFRTNTSKRLLPPPSIRPHPICLLTSTILLVCQGALGAAVLRARVIGGEPIVRHWISDHWINAPTGNIGQQKRGRADGIAMRNPRPSVSVIRQVAQVTNINGRNEPIWRPHTLPEPQHGKLS